VGGQLSQEEAAKWHLLGRDSKKVEPATSLNRMVTSRAVVSYKRPPSRPALDSELECKHEMQSQSGRPAISRRSCQIGTSLKGMVAVEENKPCSRQLTKDLYIGGTTIDEYTPRTLIVFGMRFKWMEMEMIGGRIEWYKGCWEVDLRI
jgi:hypothetical protein